ncbi:MAG TPA: hypothetical protein VNZ61_08770 [Roseomonas sp.]|nr:hypothetical protein [Roseomonas sp.]
MPEANKTDDAKVVAGPEPLKTALDAIQAEAVTTRTDPSLSFSPDLEEVPGSTAPARADGSAVPHVRGPQQAAVDPVAAGLDTGAVVATTDTNRAVNRTGEAAASPRPATYVEKGSEVQQAAPADGALVPVSATPDVPGPSGPSEGEADSKAAGKPTKTGKAP